ncbi:DNA polymerase IV [Catellatospora bangladeshensis]|uniref:DNA polymerase IV n=1 Tax=Catellatospora bangladeshensis TaxID=310355 RepID=UPI0019435922|nr:DNA polymerase IV [Catellatospora bangladeshensis]
MSGWVLHVDLDQFVAAVELLRRPELRGRPVIVGGDGDPTQRGVVSTASYAARAYGVHSGQPLRVAARKCPDAVFLPVDREAYEQASALVMAALRDTGHPVEVLGWDEAFLAADTDDPETAARDIQRRVHDATGLACTVGIGDNRLRAKLATERGKPAGLFVLTAANWYAVMGGLPTSALWGVGAKTARRLAGLGLDTVSELAAADPQALAAQLGPATGPWLVRLARGEDDTPVSAAPHVARSLGREVTFQTDLDDWADVRRELLALAAQVADEVAGQERPAARVVVKVRYAPFTTRTHGQTLPTATTDPAAVERAALAALDRFSPGRPVRLLGVRAEFPPSDVTHSPPACLVESGGSGVTGRRSR